LSRNYDLLRTLGHSPELKRIHRPRLQSAPPAPNGTPNPGPSQSTFDLVWALGVLRQRWRISLAFAGIVVLATALVSFLMKPTYDPEARIEVDPAGSEVFSLQNGTSEVGDMDRIMQTQTDVINSDELAIKLIREMRLDTRRDIAGKLAATANQPLSSDSNSDALTPAENSALSYLHKNLKASAMKNSRVITVSISSHDPRLSRDMVNTLVKLYLERNYESRYKAVAQASEWLSRQLADIRDKAEKSTQALTNYQKLHNITDIDEQQNTFAVKVSDLTKELTQAQADRIQLEAFYNSVQNGEGDSLPQVRDNPVVQNLTRSLAETETELSQAQVIYGKNHPNVQKLENGAKELQAQLDQQRASIVEGVKTSYLAAKAREQLMASQLQATSAGVNAMGEYSILKREAQVDTDLYNTLYARVKEAGIAAASKSSNIRLLEPARLLSDPSSPKPIQNIIVSLLFGLVGGVVVAFMCDRLDTSIRRPEEIPQLGSMPSLAFIPRVLPTAPALGPGMPALPPGPERSVFAEPFVIRDPGCDGAEAIRTLVSTLLAGSDAGPHVFLVVSGFSQEGKSTLSVNLSLVLSELAPTCIVDADLRRPSVGLNFGLAAGEGVAEILNGAPLETVLRTYPGVPNLRIALAGRPLANPGSALMSDAMGDLVAHLRERFTYVVIDSPPLLGYADSRALIPLADGVVVVARYARTPRDVINRTMDVLRQLHAPVLAFVLNEIDNQAEYYRYKYADVSREPDAEHAAR